MGDILHVLREKQMGVLNVKRKTKIDRTEYLFDNRALVALIIPLIIEQFLSMLVGMADSIMISSVGEAAVSGVSLVDSVVILMFNVFSALATGGSVIAGQLLGQNRIKEACESSNQLVYFTTLIATAISVICYLCKPFILNTVFGQIDADVKAHADIYLVIVLTSIPFLALYCAGAAIFRIMGNSKITMQVSMLMNAINVIGNAVLVYGFHLGTAGVAIPTLVSRMVASVVIIVLLMNPKYVIHLPKRPSVHFEWKMIKKILYIGVPNGMENSMFQLGKIIVLSLVSTFGTSSIAANAVGNVLAGFQVLPGMAISLVVTTVISRCIGADEEEQARYYTKKLMGITYICMFISVAMICLAMPVILKLYNLTDAATVEVKRILILHSVCCCIIWPFSFTLPSVFRAAGDVRFSMVMSILSMWIFRIMFSYVLGKYMGLGVFGIWAAMVADWAARSACFIWRYLSGRWKNHAVV